MLLPINHQKSQNLHLKLFCLLWRLWNPNLHAVLDCLKCSGKNIEHRFLLLKLCERKKMNGQLCLFVCWRARSCSDRKVKREGEQQVRYLSHTINDAFVLCPVAWHSVFALLLHTHTHTTAERNLSGHCWRQSVAHEMAGKDSTQIAEFVNDLKAQFVIFFFVSVVVSRGAEKKVRELSKRTYWRKNEKS